MKYLNECCENPYENRLDKTNGYNMFDKYIHSKRNITQFVLDV